MLVTLPRRGDGTVDVLVALPRGRTGTVEVLVALPCRGGDAVYVSVPRGVSSSGLTLPVHMEDVPAVNLNRRSRTGDRKADSYEEALRVHFGERSEGCLWSRLNAIWTTAPGQEGGSYILAMEVFPTNLSCARGGRCPAKRLILDVLQFLARREVMCVWKLYADDRGLTDITA